MITAKAKAASVHIFTATGAVFATLALLSAAQQNWEHLFFWLLVALFVDGVDGTLARKFEVDTHVPDYSGVVLDMIIDYATYVLIPALAFYWSGLLDGWMAWAAMIGIVFSSALYFAKKDTKSKDNCFIGFPCCWNMIFLVMFVLAPPSWFVFTAIVVLGVAMFTPLKFIHPMRTVRWRELSLLVTVIWMALGLWAIWGWEGYTTTPWMEPALIVTSVYLLLVGIVHQAIGPRAS